MLTEERVLHTSWKYVRRQDYQDLSAKFEILGVGPNGKLIIYVYFRDPKLDMTELEELTLESLEELVQRKWIVELVESSAPPVDDTRENLAGITVVAAIVIAVTGFIIFAAGVHDTHQKPWEAGIGAAMVIAALLAVALRR